MLGLGLALVPLTGSGAQIYKWVDEYGVINYSNQRPAATAAQSRVGVVENRVSVYSPDPGLARAVDQFRMRSNTNGVRKPTPPVAAQTSSAPAYLPAPAIPDPCAADCNEVYGSGSYYPGAAGYKVYGYGYPRHRIPQVRIRPGTIAGQVVGRDGYIAGNSANARRFSPTPVRRFHKPAFQPRFTGSRPVQLPARFR